MSETVDTTTEIELGVIELRLITGESLIATTWLSRETNEYILERPVVAVPRPAPSGQGITVSLNPIRPWCPTPARLPIFFSHVVYALPVSDDMAARYREMFSSIIMPQTNPIVGGSNVSLDDLIKS